MKRFWKNCKGMVTVMVTLLLVPSLLVTGTAVDFARAYAAKSILQDANQLAANSTLASYDALLQDLYGLYGIMSNDPKLAGMIDEYIQVAVLGKDGKATGLGTFQLLYGSELHTDGIVPAKGQNLGNADVLRRQIEDYAKFRVPVVLVDELLDRLESFKKVKDDADVIEKKMDLDDKLEELTKIYKKIYDQIGEVNAYSTEIQKGYEALNQSITEIHDQLKTMQDVRRQYTEYVTNPARDDPDASPEDKAHWEEYKKDYKTRYNDLMANIRSLIRGGTIKSNWKMGEWENEEERIWKAGYHANSQKRKVGLNDQVDALCDLCDNADSAMNKLVSLCEDADKKRKKLAEKIDELESKVETPGACSKGLKDSLTEKKAENGNKSALDVYRSMLKYEVEPMARALRGQNAPVLESIREQMENPVYGNWKDPNDETKRIRFSVLENLKTANGFEIDLLVYNKTATPKKVDRLDAIYAVGPSICKFKCPTGYKPFQDSSFRTTHNPEFYQELVKLFGNADNEVKKKHAKSAVTKIFSTAQDLFKGMLKYEPEGAYKYEAGSSGGAPGEEKFGQDGDWSKEDKGKDATKNALKGDLAQRLGDIGGDLADHILLLGYASEMFSCYSTNRGEKKDEVSMAGVPLGIDVNYFYQSELEYLYGGSNDAIENLKSVAGMIFLVRFVFNYIASFSITEINQLVSSVKNALSGLAGPFAFLIGELVRVGMALGESALDVGRLRSGYAVKIYKDDDTWLFSMNGLLNAISDGKTDSVTGGEKSNSPLDYNGADGLDYRDYLRVFLLLQSDANLAQRTRKLIELNVTNKKNEIGGKGDHTAREAAMKAVPLVDLSKAVTGFSITTTVDLRMIFLSQPFAQRGVDGVVPPGKLPISVTDHRGY